jgi:O-methyltransferase involved in polyketide biosynthesis
VIAIPIACHLEKVRSNVHTFFLRNSYLNSNLQAFELDSPGTQAWKLARLAQARQQEYA